MPQLFYVNLDRNPTRRRHIEQQIAAAGLCASAERIPAVDGGAIDGSNIAPELLGRRGRRALEHGYTDGLQLSPGALALALTYRSLWKRIVSKRIVSSLILEDDASLDNGFATKLGDILGELPGGWDLVYLGYSAGARATLEIFSPSLAVPSGQINCTHAYLLSLAGATRLLEECFPLQYQIDTHIYQAFGHLEVFCATPPIATTDHRFASDIQC